MTSIQRFNISELPLLIENFHPHYLDESGQENLQLVETINEIIYEVPKHCNIICGIVWIEDNIAFEPFHSIRIQSKIFDTGKVIYNRLKKSDQFCLFLCSAGKGMSEWSRRLFIEGDFLKGYLVDMAGSLIAELTADKLEKIIESEAAIKGLSITNRYSPGYCNWNVSEQQHLFSFFPENFCGVSLSASSLMIPEKSVSGLIGVGKNVKKVPYTCSMCKMENCIYSKLKRTERLH